MTSQVGGAQACSNVLHYNMVQNINVERKPVISFKLLLVIKDLLKGEKGFSVWLRH